MLSMSQIAQYEFQSTPPRRHGHRVRTYFNPRPPRGGRPQYYVRKGIANPISGINRSAKAYDSSYSRSNFLPKTVRTALILYDCLLFASDNYSVLWIVSSFRSELLDLCFIFVPQIVKPQTVLFRINQFQKLRLQAFRL